MGKETERKFLVRQEIWEKLDKPQGKHYRQGYLLNAPDRNVRVRVAGDRGYLTIKGPGKGITRSEYEYEIPKAEAEELLEEFKPESTEKIRYRIPASGGLTWEIDEFLGDNEGLIVAEIELEDEEQQFDLPDWLGREVTDDKRYANASLARCPFRDWAEKDYLFSE